MRIYWYAPFNNALEMPVAGALGGGDHEVVVQSLSTRRGKRPEGDPSTCRVVRDLPDTAGDDGGRRSRWRRARIAIARASARQRLVASESFDIVHLHTYNPFTDPLALPLVRRRSRRLVVSVHNVRPHDRRLASHAIELSVLRAGYRQADRLVVAHDHLARQLVDDFGVAPARVSVVPLAVVTPDPPAAPPGNIAGPVLFFGTLRHNKGLEVLLDAMGKVTDPSIRLHVAGRGAADLEAMVRRAAVDGRITVEVGYVEPQRQDELLRLAGCVVLPYTEFDAQSGVLRDAYAYGRPVIVSDVGALGAEVAEHGSGIVVPPEDPAALADAIERLSHEPESRRALAGHASQVARERSPSAIAECLLRDYETALSAAPA